MRLFLNEVPTASLTIGSARIVFCTSHSFILPCKLELDVASPLNGAVSMSTKRVESASTCFIKPSSLSMLLLSAFSASVPF